MKKVKTYIDNLMEDEKFRKSFDKEYKNLCIGEQIAEARHRANLTQTALAKRMDTTKSAVSRYESADYRGYTLKLLERIADACGAELRIIISSKLTKSVHGTKRM
jgi:transcriptional regulator with XRE-family HTH domain